MTIKSSLKQLRRVCQLICLGVFLALFRLTDYFGEDTIPYAVNILFRLDPLVLATVSLAQKALIPLLLPALGILLLTLITGRSFCGWICPLGTLLDLSARVIPTKNIQLRLSFIKYMLLGIILAGAVFGIQLAGFVDPFSLLVRALVFSLDPALKYLASAIFDTVYTAGPEWMIRISEFVYDGLKAFVLPYKQSFFYLSVFSFVLLAVIFLLETAGRRFWCRNLCPLGGLLALVSRFAFFKRVPQKSCRHCGMCASNCRMASFDDNDRFLFEECNLCMDCLAFCPDRITTFKFSLPFNRPAPLDISKRQWIAAGLAGVALPVMLKTSAVSKHIVPSVIRPPGAREDPDFSALCVRCGECMKVCINNALQPLFMEKGIEGMFTPQMIPRLGYCELNCTLCTQVCPTGAIETLTRAQKHQFVVGKAVLDKNKCLVYAQKKGCIVCEEHCPVHDKAIKFTRFQTRDMDGRPVTLQQPYVVEQLCIGCGICEFICPVQGTAAIRVSGKTRQNQGDAY